MAHVTTPYINGVFAPSQAGARWRSSVRSPARFVGPMATRAHFDSVQSYIRIGLEAGTFARPTVFVDVRPDMRIAQGEIFGPALSVLTYRDDEAVRIANGTAFGPQAYVLGEPDHVRRVAVRIRAGRVLVNAPSPDSDAPFGGFKQSGVGRESGRYGIDEYFEYASVLGA